MPLKNGNEMDLIHLSLSLLEYYSSSSYEKNQSVTAHALKKTI